MFKQIRNRQVKKIIEGVADRIVIRNIDQEEGKEITRETFKKMYRILEPNKSFEECLSYSKICSEANVIKYFEDKLIVPDKYLLYESMNGYLNSLNDSNKEEVKLTKKKAKDSIMSGRWTSLNKATLEIAINVFKRTGVSDLVISDLVLLSFPDYLETTLKETKFNGDQWIFNKDLTQDYDLSIWCYADWSSYEGVKYYRVLEESSRFKEEVFKLDKEMNNAALF